MFSLEVGYFPLPLLRKQMKSDSYTSKEMTFRLRQNKLFSTPSVAISKCTNELQRGWWQCDRSRTPPRKRKVMVMWGTECLPAFKDWIKPDTMNRFITCRTVWSSKMSKQFRSLNLQGLSNHLKNMEALKATGNLSIMFSKHDGYWKSC